MKKLSDLFKIYKGKKAEATEVDTGFRYIQIGDLRNDDVLKFAVKSPSNVLCDTNDILIAWDGANAGTIGYNLSGVLGSTLAKLTPKVDGINIDYAGRFLQSKFKYLRENCTGATIPHISRHSLESLQVPLPPLKTQKKIAAILDEADSYKQMTKTLLDKYDALTQSLFLDMFGDPVTNPKGWGKTPMSDLMKIVRGGSPRPIDKFLGGTYPWIKIGDATKGNDIYLESTKQHIIEEGLKKTRLLPKGSLIFANCGVSLGFARILTFEGCIHDGWLAFSEIDKKELNEIFLLKALNSITRYFRETAPDGTQPNLNISIMSKFKIILPPIELQNKFEKSLFQIEAQKAQAEQSLLQAENLFNSLLQEAYKGELV
ncbi:restriction endonuclease subunit S [Maribacter arcticus]|nr:restriction endonuclease subunit S [Maribacter arcticus]MDA9089715.1 restriction endonuclease subunit S [Maribacter arcticus]